MAAALRGAGERLKPPPSEAIERFSRDLILLTGASPSAAQSLGLAVSGGADSVAMLVLAAAAFPGAVHAATVNHGLRADAADEAAMVATLCAELDVPHACLDGSGRMAGAGSVQERARTLRYALLERWAAEAATPRRWIAVAHQRDDVAEGFLLRARRGAGLGGLAAMPARRPLGASPSWLVRPLLGWSRAELRGIAQCVGAPFFDDPSNADPRHDRSRIRALLGATPELTPGRLALAAQNLRHAEDALAWVAERAWSGRVSVGDEGVTIDASDLPYEVQRRLLRRAIAAVRARNGRGEQWHEQGLDRLAQALLRGEPGTLADVLARAEGKVWRVAMAPPRRSH